MKFSALSAFASLAVSVNLVHAVSIPTAGAAYFITNEPTGNFVVSADIGFDGRLTFAGAVSAGGVGAHGIQNPNGDDPFFSQGAVEVSSNGRLLATVNAGSDTVALFAIDPVTPSKLTMIGKPVSSAGEFPVSVAINKAGTQVCVLNGGAVNGVKCFAVDQKAGLVAQASGLRPMDITQTTPPTGPAGAVSDIIFSEDGTKLIASVKGTPPTPGFLATWTVAADGTTSPAHTKSTPAAGSLLPFSMTVIPGRNALLVTDAGTGFDVFSWAGSSASATSSVVSIPNQLATCWSSFSQKTGNFYLSDPARSTLTEVHVDANLKGSIVKQYQQKNGTNMLDSDMATLAGQDFLFVLSPNSLTVESFLPAAPGVLLNWQSFDFSAGAARAGITINPKNLQGMAAIVKSQFSSL